MAENIFQLIKLTSKDLYNGIPYWCETIHKQNIEKGWWDGGVENRNLGEIILLVKSEIIEAYEEYRKKDSDIRKIYYVDGSPKPEGFPVEIADAVIRLFDLAYAYSTLLPDGEKVLGRGAIMSRFVGTTAEDSFTESLGESLDNIIVSIGKTRTSAEHYLNVTNDKSGMYSIIIVESLTMVGTLFHLCDSLTVDLGNAIALKHTYNGTRPHRHGGKRA